MTKIMNLFSRLSHDKGAAAGDGLLGRRSGKPDVDLQPNAQDIAAFENLGASHKTIDLTVAHVVQGLSGVQALIDHMASLKLDLLGIFEDHRKLALLNSTLRQDLERSQQRFLEKSASFDSLAAEAGALRADYDKTRNELDRALSDLEAMEQRHHVLGVAKKEADDQLARSSSQLADAQEESDSLRLKSSMLQDMLDENSTRLSELTARFNETNSDAVMLSNRCETLERSLQEKVDEVIDLNERVQKIYHERDAAIAHAQQKEQEASHSRSEMNRIFQQMQQEKKARELEISQLKIEIDCATTRVNKLEEVAAEAVAENERLVVTSRRFEELNKQLEASSGLLETKIQRLSTTLESTVNAKSQIEQSRAAMSARLETVTQLLSDREQDVKRLEAEVLRLTARLEEEGERSNDKLEAFSNRVFEVEKELQAQRNETAFYASQLKAAQLPAVRTPQR